MPESEAEDTEEREGETGELEGEELGGGGGAEEWAAVPCG